jgi:hypothetical protein
VAGRAANSSAPTAPSERAPRRFARAYQQITIETEALIGQSNWIIAQRRRFIETLDVLKSTGKYKGGLYRSKPRSAVHQNLSCCRCVGFQYPGLRRAGGNPATTRSARRPCAMLLLFESVSSKRITWIGLQTVSPAANDDLTNAAIGASRHSGFSD